MRKSIRDRLDKARRAGLGALGVLGLATGGLLLMSGSASAQQAGAEVWGLGGCSSCHGNLAEGGTDPAAPTGPSLRRTRLDAAALIEVISCGRPGSQMPANLAGAYTETPCYGQPPGPMPADVVPGASLTAEELTSLVDFLVAEVVGKTRITLENCAAFYGGDINAIGCIEYR